MCRYANLLIIPFFMLLEASVPAEERFHDIKVRIDCTHNYNLSKGANQRCGTISGFSVLFKRQFSTKLMGYVRMDPFGTTSKSLEDRVIIYDARRPEVRDTKLVLIDDYALKWQFRKNLVLSIEEFGGTTLLPSMSMLSFASAFQDSGWDQTALVASYNLAVLDGIRMKIAIGNGEGENGENLDVQQYAGIGIKVGVIEGVKFKYGMSFDGNNYGSGFYRWQFRLSEDSGELSAKQGFSTQRMAAALFLDGNLLYARGLKASVGWQRVVLTDLSRDDVVPEDFYKDPGNTFDVNDILIEDRLEDSKNQTIRTVHNFNFSYLFLATYFIGFDYETRTVNAGSVDFFELINGKAKNILKQNSYTVGGGLTIADGLKLTLAYNSSEYSQPYRFFNFKGKDGTLEKSRQIFNARFLFNW